jgi:hypothetical protein
MACGCATTGSTLLSMASVKQVVFPLPLWACKNSIQSIQMHPAIVSRFRLKQCKVCCTKITCAIRLLCGGVKIIGKVSA